MSWRKWRRLPWWEQRALIEGMTREFADPDDLATALANAKPAEDDELRRLGVTFN